MLTIGHRGAQGYMPENTLSSFQKALDLKVDMVELDVCFCKTGELIVFHDERLERTTNGSGYIFDKTISELKSLNAGNGQQIPTLEEVLDLVNKRAGVNIELKVEHSAKAVADIIENYILNKGWAEEMFLVSSLNHHELSELKKIMPKIKIDASFFGNPIDYAKFGSDLGAWSVSLTMEFVNQEFIDDAHTRGLKVIVYTVNYQEDIKRMKSLGVDGVISDFPDRIGI